MSPKQERFVQEYLKDSNGTQAAIRAGYSPRTADQQASRLLTKVKVAQAVKAKQEKASVKAELTLDAHIATLAELRDEARAASQYPAAIAAEISRGKAVGLYVERTTQVKDTSKLSDAELEAEDKRLRKGLKLA